MNTDETQALGILFVRRPRDFRDHRSGRTDRSSSQAGHRSGGGGDFDEVARGFGSGLDEVVPQYRAFGEGA
jgi:hypothetical protein